MKPLAAMAKAICCPDGKCMAGNVGPHNVPCIYQDHLPSAIAALAALRSNVNFEMETAGRNAVDDDYGLSTTDASTIFNAMCTQAGWEM